MGRASIQMKRKGKTFVKGSTWTRVLIGHQRNYMFLLFKTIDPNPTVSLSWSKLKQKSFFFFMNEIGARRGGGREGKMIIREHHLPLTYVLWAFALSYTCWVTVESAVFSLGRKTKKESQSKAELSGNMLLRRQTRWLKNREIKWELG